MFKPKNEGKR